MKRKIEVNSLFSRQGNEQDVWTDNEDTLTQALVIGFYQTLDMEKF